MDSARDMLGRTGLVQTYLAWHCEVPLAAWDGMGRPKMRRENEFVSH